MGLFSGLKGKIQSVVVGNESITQPVMPLSTREKIERLIVSNPGIAKLNAKTQVAKSAVVISSCFVSKGNNLSVRSLIL